MPKNNAQQKELRKQALALRSRVDSLKGFRWDERLSHDEIDKGKAEQLWHSHTQLLGELYPKRVHTIISKSR